METKRCIVLGIDPGTHVTGYALVSQEGSSLKHVHSGHIQTKKADPLSKRLHTVHTGLKKIIDTFCPTHAAVESVFTFKNVKSAIILSHARGVALLACSSIDLDVMEYSPMEVKMAAVGYGRASKDQVAQMMQKLFRPNHTNQGSKTDAYDALAVAFCHLQHLQLQRKIAASMNKNTRTATR